MTLKKFLLVILALMMLGGTASAISLFKDGLPANLSAGANVTIAESIEENPQTPAHVTSLAVERTHPGNTTPASVITISLKVSNRGNERGRARLAEDQRPGLVYPDSIPVKYHNYEAMRIPYYSWDLILEPGSTQTITYRVKPDAVGMVAFTAALLTDEYGNQVESAMTNIRVSCIPNGICDAGENLIFCPEDCPSGGSDGICDGVPDGKIDPDCLPGVDPDSGLTPTPTPAPASIPTKQGLPGASAAITLATAAIAIFLVQRSRTR
jgi:hypothetical protein